MKIKQLLYKHVPLVQALGLVVDVQTINDQCVHLSIHPPYTSYVPQLNLEGHLYLNPDQDEERWVREFFYNTQLIDHHQNPFTGDNPALTTLKHLFNDLFPMKDLNPKHLESYLEIEKIYLLATTLKYGEFLPLSLRRLPQVRNVLKEQLTLTWDDDFGRLHIETPLSDDGLLTKEAYFLNNESLNEVVLNENNDELNELFHELFNTVRELAFPGEGHSQLVQDIKEGTYTPHYPNDPFTHQLYVNFVLEYWDRLESYWASIELFDDIYQATQGTLAIFNELVVYLTDEADKTDQPIMVLFQTEQTKQRIEHLKKNLF